MEILPEKFLIIHYVNIFLNYFLGRPPDPPTACGVSISPRQLVIPTDIQSWLRHLLVHCSYEAIFVRRKLPLSGIRIYPQ